MRIVGEIHDDIRAVDTVEITSPRVVLRGHLLEADRDQVPVLGDLPLIGRLFRTEGESVQKRNLLIFVTANLVSPGGSPAFQYLPGVEPNTLYQNRELVTPEGLSRRAE